jgi:hypothetical protein
LPQAPGTGSRAPAEGDLWGAHRRLLAALLESLSVRDAPSAARAVILDAVMGIDGGFAGFIALAYLTLAEAASIAGPAGNVDVVKWAPIYAQRAAARIRDVVYCLRVCARVRAMRLRWWPTPEPGALVAAIEALAADPIAPEFATVHVVGEMLEQRPADHVPAAPENALTLLALADLYKRPVEEFARLNTALGVGVDDPLPALTHVNVPDRGFAPLLAARLSAAVLAGPPGPDRGRLIRRLVPVAGPDATALATTLSRLILASPTDAAELLEDLRALADGHVAAAPAFS